MKFIFYILLFLVSCEESSHISTKKKNLIQFTGLVGKHPQKPFNPEHFPKSKNNKNPNQTNEGVKIVAYARKNRKIYILLGKEKSHHGNASEKWNLLGGSVPIGKNYLGAAVEELKQESVGSYETTPNELSNTHYDVYISGMFGNLTCTFFLEVPFKEARVIENKLSNPNLPSNYKEMTNYMWVDLKSLKENFKNNIKFSKISHGYEIEVTSENGNKEKINLYNYSWDILIQAYEKKYFDNL